MPVLGLDKVLDADKMERAALPVTYPGALPSVSRSQPDPRALGKARRVPADLWAPSAPVCLWGGRLALDY